MSGRLNCTSNGHMRPLLHVDILSSRNRDSLQQREMSCNWYCTCVCSNVFVGICRLGDQPARSMNAMKSPRTRKSSFGDLVGDFPDENPNLECQARNIFVF